jgi:hypothetical protein
MINSENTNFIELLDGRKIIAFLKANQPETEEPEIPQGERPVVKMVLADSRLTFLKNQTQEEKDERQKDLFLKNAFFFVENRERILADSRMFLAHVPMQSGLMYTGISGFIRPTLGIYLQWWETCQSAVYTNAENEKMLIFRLSGSPLSGTNSCRAVNSAGKDEKVALTKFCEAWTSFYKINTSYTEAKNRFEAYTIEEVVNILNVKSI